MCRMLQERLEIAVPDMGLPVYHFSGMLVMCLADGYIQGACAKGQQWQWSLQLLQEMALQDVQDTIVMGGLMW